MNSNNQSKISKFMSIIRPNWFFSKNIENIAISDTGGKLYSFTIMDQVINLRQRLFRYEQWPFKYQDAQELELYLFYGAVEIFELNKELIFVPVQISNYLTPLNYKKTTITLGNVPYGTSWNKNILEAFNSTTKAKKDEFSIKLPFIFDSNTQIAPYDVQAEIYRQIKKVFNANSSNRVTKSKKWVMGAKKGESVNKSFIYNSQVEDFSPVFIVENEDFQNEINKDLLGKSPFGVDVPPSTDLYASFSKELLDWEKKIMILNGLRTPLIAQKPGVVQETDTQQENSNVPIAIKLVSMLETRKKWIKQINSIFGKNLKISLNSNEEKFIKDTLNNQEENGEEKEENEINRN